MYPRSTAEIIAWAERERKQMTIFGHSTVQAVIVYRVKAPLVAAVNRLAAGRLTILEVIHILRVLWLVRRAIRELPEPTRENTWNPNTHILLDLRDYLLEHIRLTPDRVHFFEVVTKLGIICYDYDTPYRRMVDKCVEKLQASDWQPSPPPAPNVWKE